MPPRQSQHIVAHVCGWFRSSVEAVRASRRAAGTSLVVAGVGRSLRVEGLEDRRMLAADLYVNDDWASETSWTWTDVDDSHDVNAGDIITIDAENFEFGSEAFSIIQAAVDAATTNQTIQVYEGAYAEVVSIPAAKSNLTLLGANAGVSAGWEANLGDRDEESVVAGGFNVQAPGATIDGFTITTGYLNPGDWLGIFLGNAADGATVGNNIITGPNTNFNERGITIHADNVTLADNDISGWKGSGISFSAASSGNSVTGNKIQGALAGIGSSGLSNTVIEGNYFLNNGEGFGGDTVGTGVVVSNNKFEGNPLLIAHYGGAEIIAENNTGNAAAIEGGSVFSTIQAAIDAAASGAKIHVGAGTYNEFVAIDDKDLQLLGHGAGVVTLQSDLTETALTVSGASNVLIDGFTIEDGFFGIEVDGASAAISVYNTVLGSGNQTGVRVINGGSALIENSTIDGPGSGTGLSVTSGGSVEVTGSVLTGRSIGALIGASGLATLHGNDLSYDFSNRAILSSAAGVIDASGNWWGPTDDSLVAAKVQGQIDFTPYLEGGAPTATGFAGNFSHLHVSTKGSQFGGGPRIQEAINLVDGSTVTVHDGTYDETVQIDMAGLTLESANPHGAKIAPTTGSQQVIISVDAEHVTIDGFAIQVNQNLSRGQTIAPVGIGAVQTEFDGLTIRNNKITSIGASEALWDGTPSLPTSAAGIVLYSGGGAPSVTIQGNGVEITASGAASFFQRAVWLAQLNVALTDNVLAGAANDVQFQFASGGASLLDDNDFTGQHRAGGAGVVIAGPNTGSPITISNNRFTPSAGDPFNIQTALQINQNHNGATSPVAVTGNEFKGHVIGVVSYNSGGLTIDANKFTPAENLSFLPEIGDDFIHIAIDSASPSAGASKLLPIEADIKGNVFNAATDSVGVAVGVADNLLGGTFGDVEIGVHGDNTYNADLGTGIRIAGGKAVIEESIADLDVAVEVLGGAAKVQNTVLTDNTTGVRITGAAALTLGAGNAIAGGATGLLFAGVNVELTGLDLSDLSISGQSGDYIKLANGAFDGAQLDGTDLTLDGVHVGDLAFDPFAAEDKITHEIDDNALGLVLLTAKTVYVTPATAPTATDNDYTRIRNAVEAVSDGWTIVLDGKFDWTEDNAAASWAAGNDGDAGTAADNYAIVVPGGLNGVTITASGDLGEATIQGPGDIPTVDLEGFLYFAGGPTAANDNQGWTISKLEILDFDLAIGMFNSGAGTDAFAGTKILGNRIAVAKDVATAGDTLQNLAIHYSYGKNQTIQGNFIELRNDSITVGANFASNIGMQSNTSGGDAYDGLLIDGNAIDVYGEQDASHPGIVMGIWENGHAHLSNITVSNNDFINHDPGNDPSVNLQRAFRVTSHSGASSTVAYTGNTVEGANIGFQWISGSDFSGQQPVQLAGNVLENVGAGFLIQSNGQAVLSDNALANSGAMAKLGIGVDVALGSIVTVDDAVNDNTIHGFAAGIRSAGTIIVTDNDASIHGNVIGIDVAGGTATITGNHIYDNATGIRFTAGGGGSVTGNDFTDDDANGVDLRIDVAAGTITIGDGNQYAGDDYFIDNRSSQTFYLTGHATATYAGLTPGDLADDFRIEDRMHHALDGGAFGLIRWVAGELFVTEPGSGASDETIQRAVNAAAGGDTIHVEAGTYVEDVLVNKSGLHLLGAGPGATIVSGSAGGDGATIRIAGSNVELAGFKITREGNNADDWNDPNLNFAGIAIQGQSISGALIHDNDITGNRTGIDVNDSSSHTIRNNVVENNHTGLFFRNATDNLTVVENAIVDNRTVGILFLDASGGKNSPLQQAVNSTFFNNNISGNWYAQIVDRQSGGALPAPGTTNLKDFSGNWFGTAAPVITNANSAEPAYGLASLPTYFGGEATAPGGQPHIAGPASANFDVTPWLSTGGDTDVETTLGRGTYGFQGDFSKLTVTAELAQTGGVGRVQEGVDRLEDGAATGGDRTVQVLAGDFSGQVNIAKSLSLIGTVDMGGDPVTTLTANLPGGGDLVTIQGDDFDGDQNVHVQNIAFLGNGASNVDSGLRVDSSARFAELTVANSTFTKFDTIGIAVFGDVTNKGKSVERVALTELTFTDNGFQSIGGAGDVNFFEYNGDAALTDLVLSNVGNNPPNSPRGGIQFRGVGTLADGSDRLASGVVTLTNVDISGKYRNYFLTIQKYTDVSGFDLTDVKLGGAASELFGGFGALLRIDGVGSGTIDASPTFDLGNIHFRGLAGSTNSPYFIEFAPDNNYAFLRVDATGALWEGTAANALTVSQLFGVEDRVLHYVDANHPTHGPTFGPFKGFAEVINGAAFVTATHDFTTGAAGVINRAIAAVDDGGMVHIATGIYGSQDVSTAGKSVTLSVGSSPGQVTIDGDLTLDSDDTLAIEIDGTNTTDFDNLIVKGTVTLGDAALDPSRGFDPFPGDSFTIIDNDLVDEVDGMFAGRSEGSKITVGGIPFTISYKGGDGNDVTLTVEQPDVVWVNDDWADGIDVGDDPDDGFSAASSYGYDAFDNIADAIAAVAAGGTIYVFGGAYDEAVVVDKDGLTLEALADAEHGEADAIVTRTSGAANLAIFTVTAPNVTIDGFDIHVNRPHANAGIYASDTLGNFHGVQLLNNTITAFGTGGSFITPDGNHASPAIVLINMGGLVETYTIQGNTITGNSPAEVFSRGIWLTRLAGTIGGPNPGEGNTIGASTQDVLLRFTEAGTTLVQGNTFLGAGVDISETNPTAGAINILDNDFTPVSPSFNQSLAIKLNYAPGRTVLVEGNEFTGHGNFAIISGASTNVTITDNVFTPHASATNYTHVLMSTSYPTGGMPLAIPNNSISLTGNEFNGNGTAVGRALDFQNGNSGGGSGFGAITVGGAGPLANTFAEDLTEFIRLAPTPLPPLFAPASNPFPAPFHVDVDASQNLFDVGSVPELPEDMLDADLFALEDKIVHKIDHVASGLVTVVADNVYVTPASFLAPFTTSASIQRGVDAVTDGGVVHVAAGTYVENVVVNKSVEIAGAGQASTVVLPSFIGANTGGGSLTLGASSVFLVQADNVTIHGLTVDGDNPALDSGISRNDADVDARNGIITDHTSGTYHNLVVHHVAVQNIYLRGIQFSNGNGFHLYDNVVTNVAGEGASIAVFNSGGSGVIERNEVSLANDGIAANHSRGTQFLDNVVTDSGSGIHSDNNGSSGGVADLIQGNSVSDGSVPNGSYGIWVFAAYLPTQVLGNDVSNVDVGIGVFGSFAPITVEVTGNDIDLEDRLDSLGIWVSTTLFGFGSGNVSALIDGDNKITGAHTGIYVHDESASHTAQATISNNTTSIHGNVLGIDVDGGVALVQNNNLNGNTIGVRIQNGGVADLGQIGPGEDFTGLGVSTGGNDFSAYVDEADAGSGAIVNLNTGGSYSNVGPQGLTGPDFDVTAFGNLWAVPTSPGIEDVIYHDADEAALGFIDYATLDNLVVSLDDSLIVAHDDVDEGGSITIYGEFTNDAQAHVVTINWGDGSPNSVVMLDVGEFTFSITSPIAAYVDDPDGPVQSILHNITVKVAEAAFPTNSLEDDLSVTVHNVAPVIDLSASAVTIAEGAVYTLKLGDITDPGADPGNDTVTQIVVIWGDASPPDVYDIPGDFSLPHDLTHVYADGPNNYIIEVRLFDDDGLHEILDNTLTVTVDNVEPTALFNNAGPVSEGASGGVFFVGQSDPSPVDASAGFRYAFDFDDNGTWDLGDGAYGGSVATPSVAVPASFLADGPGTYTIKGRIIDKDGGVNDYVTTITVNNVAPAVNAGADVSVFPAAVLGKVITFTDPGAEGMWTVSIDWDGDSTADESFDVSSHSFNIADHSTWEYQVGDVGQTFTVTVWVDDGDAVGFDTFDVEVTADTFQVASVDWNDSGFRLAFNRPADPSEINLYNWINSLGGGPTGGNANLDPVDLIVSGPGGAVRGSLIWNETYDAFDWVKTGGALAAGDYSVTLVSGDGGFEDALGEDLDGDFNDATPGGDYVSPTHTVAIAGGTRTVGMPDFARGASATEGQPLNLPYDDTVDGLGIPIVIDEGTGVTAVDFQFVYDAALLDIPAANALDASSFVGLPAGWSVAVAFLDHGTTSGLARINVSLSVASMTPLPAGPQQLVRIAGSIRAGAEYGAAQVLQLNNLDVNEGLILARADAAIHKAVFVGDADGSATYDASDAALISGVAVDNAQPFTSFVGRTGLRAYPTFDPVIVADVTRNGSVGGLDASWVAQKALYVNFPMLGNQPEIPDYPSGTVVQFSGVDPTLDMDNLVLAAAGGTVVVPIRVTDTLAPGGDGVLGFIVGGSYDTTKLDLDELGLSLGSLLTGEGNWGYTANVNDAVGVFGLSVFRTNGQPTTVSAPDTVVVNVEFDVDPDAPSGETPIELSGPATTGVEPTFNWTYVDGSILIDAEGPTVEAVRVGSTAWTSDFKMVADTTSLNLGYIVPDGDDQLRTLPWTNINQVMLTFSEDVEIAIGDLCLYGADNVDYTTFIEGFSYDAETFTATWTLDPFLEVNKYLIVVSDAVVDRAGNALDGEWNNDGDSYPSGNGDAKGTFSFQMNILPGDVNADGVVLGDDLGQVRAKQFQFTSGGVSTEDYSVFYDVNGDGLILGDDVGQTRARQFTTLPAGEPVAPPMLPALAMLVSEVGSSANAMTNSLRQFDGLAERSARPSWRPVLRPEFLDLLAAARGTASEMSETDEHIVKEMSSTDYDKFADDSFRVEASIDTAFAELWGT